MKPNCCCPLRFAIKSVAIIDFMAASLGVLVTSGALIYVNLFTPEVDTWFREVTIEAENLSSNNVTLIQERLQFFINFRKLWMEDGGLLATGLLILGLIYTLQKLGLACLLILGVFQERVKLLRIWVVYNLIVVVLSVIGFLSLLMSGVAEPWSIPFFVAAFLSREYVIWMTSDYIKALVESGSDDAFLIRGRGQRNASDKVVYKL